MVLQWLGSWLAAASNQSPKTTKIIVYAFVPGAWNAAPNLIYDSVSIIATIALQNSHRTTPSLDNPIQSSVIIFGASSLINLLLFTSFSLEKYQLRGVYQRLTASANPSSPTQAKFINANDEDPDPLQVESPSPWSLNRRSCSIVLVAGLALAARVEMLRWKTRDPQCCIWNVEILVPVLIVVFDQFSSSEVTPGCTGFRRHVPNLVPVMLLTTAGLIQAFYISRPRSTYICSSMTQGAILIPTSQFLSLTLDIVVLRAFEMLLRQSCPGQITAKSCATMGVVFMVSTLTLLVNGIIALGTYFRYESDYTLDLDPGCWSSILWCTTFLNVLIFAATFIIKKDGLSCFTTSLGYITTVFDAWSQATSETALLDPGLLVAATFSCTIIFGLASWTHRLKDFSSDFDNQHSEFQSRPLKTRLCLGLLTGSILLMTYNISGQQELGPHPIILLMQKGSERAQHWAQQASTSQNLTDSVKEYQRRYQRHPPPGFDNWYNFASEHDSAIIDDFDSLMNDLEPFWALSPAEIRRRMHDTRAHDDWVEVISVKQGRVELGTGENHRWMVENIQRMLEPFSTHLPDLEFIFNLNDEPRAYVPFEKMQRFRNEAEHYLAHLTSHLSDPVRNEWSGNRLLNLNWSEPGQLYPFREFPRRQTFSHYTTHCPPTSPARTARRWNRHELCVSCFSSHSIGPFVSDWPLSFKPCHQPDLEFLHGAYHPAVRQVANDLVPIFSPSKLDGFVDILMPAPFNYGDGAPYDENNEDIEPLSYMKKENTMFWRGATSEGWSEHGSWQGYVRERLTHMTNSSNFASLRATLPIHLPTRSRGQDTWTCSMLTPKKLKAFDPSIDAAFVELVRNSSRDGQIKEHEFSTVPRVPFETFWNYRFLFDGDGSAYSGRFRAFLMSKALPLKSGLHKVWWDSRLTAWKHFVPLDVRLHGLYDTLLYFMGASSKEADVVLPVIPGNVEAGEDIAMSGRKWARKVLRKVDMEIYMFRLLLEWARLTDDAREEIGFTV